MADGPNDFRDPKVTTSSPSGGIGKWIGLAIAALVALLLLLWLFGAFDDDEEVVVDQPVVEETETPDAVIVTE